LSAAGGLEDATADPLGLSVRLEGWEVLRPKSGSIDSPPTAWEVLGPKSGSVDGPPTA